MPVLNEEKHLRAAVESILEQEYPRQFDLCIALGPSRDATDEVARQLVEENPRVSTVANPTGRRSTGLNSAIAATAGEVVVRVDGHAVLPPGYIRRAVETMLRTGAINVGGVQEAVGSTPFEQAAAAALTSPFGMGGARFHAGGQEGAVDTVFLGVFRRDALEAVGGFDFGFEPNEDYELNVRLRRAGGTVWFDPTLRVTYVPRGSLKRVAQQFFHYGKGKRRTLRSHPQSLKARQAVPPALLLTLFGSMLMALWTPWTLLAPLAYVSAVVAAAIVVGRRPTRMARLAIIFPTMHLSWAFGFFFGGWRRPQPSITDR